MLAHMLKVPQHWFADWVARRLPPVHSLQLRQQHIFILPTRTGVAFLLALLLMLLVAINYQNSLAYGLTFLLASLSLLSMFHTWRNLAGLTLSAAGTTPCFAGEQGLYSVRLHSSQRAYQAIAVGFKQQAVRSVDIAAQGEQSVELAVLGQQRGWQAAPRLRIETRFPFGLFVAWSQVSLAQQMLVYPKPDFTSAVLGRSAGTEHESQQASSVAGVDDYQGLAAWQAGDSLRRIHWKAWSKGQGLLIKQFSEQQGQEQVLDFNQLSGAVEWRLSVLCAQVLRLSQSQQPYSVVLPKQRLGPDSGLDHQQCCLRALALYGITQP